MPGTELPPLEPAAEVERRDASGRQPLRAWLALIGVAQLVVYAALPCEGLPVLSVVATAVAAGLPGLFLTGVVRLPAGTGARIAVVLAVAAVTVGAGALVVLSNLCF